MGATDTQNRAQCQHKAETGHITYTRCTNKKQSPRKKSCISAMVVRI